MIDPFTVVFVRVQRSKSHARLFIFVKIVVVKHHNFIKSKIVQIDSAIE